MAKKIRRELNCLLTEEEKGKIGIEACKERDRARELKEEASTLEKSAKEKEHQVAQGVIKRMVDCHDVKNFDDKEVTVKRIDDEQYWPEGKDIVEKRPMRPEEWQELLNITPGNDEPKNDADDEEPEGDEPPKIVVVAPKRRTKKPKD